MTRPSRTATVGLLGLACLVAIVVLAAILPPWLSENLNAASGVLVALFALAAIWIERARDLRDAESEQSERKAAERRIGTLAFRVHRELKEWDRQLSGEEPRKDIIVELREWGEMLKDVSHPDMVRVYRELVDPLMDKWRTSRESQETVEREPHELQSIAPRASSHFGEALDRAFVRFYEFAGRFNRQLHESPAEPDWHDLATGLVCLREAVAAVRSIVPPRLFDIAGEDIPLPPSLLLGDG